LADYEPPAIEGRALVNPPERPTLARRQWPNDPWPRSTLVTEVCGATWTGPSTDPDDERGPRAHRCAEPPGVHWPHRCRCGAAHDEHWE
jgi:hypothetical protein